MATLIANSIAKQLVPNSMQKPATADTLNLRPPARLPSCLQLLSALMEVHFTSFPNSYEILVEHLRTNYLGNMRGVHDTPFL
jgi:hypothetical protein